MSNPFFLFIAETLTTVSLIEGFILTGVTAILVGLFDIRMKVAKLCQWKETMEKKFL